MLFFRFGLQERARKQHYAAIAADKLYSDVTSGLEDSSTMPYDKTIGSSTATSLPDYPPHIWQLPLPPPGGDTFASARCRPLLPHAVAAVSVATKGESDYSVGGGGSLDSSRYFVLDHHGHAIAPVVVGCHDSQ